MVKIKFLNYLYFKFLINFKILFFADILMLSDSRRFKLKSDGTIEVVAEPLIEEEDNDGVIFDTRYLSDNDERFDSDYEEKNN